MKLTADIIKKRKKANQYRKDYYNQYPWKKTLSTIKRRCNGKKTKQYTDYGGRGIKCLITEEELKKLWFKNKAYTLKRPSINRKDNDGNYTYENCEYIELGKNTAERNTRILSKPIVQLSLEHKHIKEWESTYKAAKILDLNPQNICLALKGKTKQAYGFIWKYL